MNDIFNKEQVDAVIHFFAGYKAVGNLFRFAIDVLSGWPGLNITMTLASLVRKVWVRKNTLSFHHRTVYGDRLSPPT